MRRDDLYRAAHAIKPDPHLKYRLAAVVTLAPERRWPRVLASTLAACVLFVLVTTALVYMNDALFGENPFALGEPDETVLLPGAGTAVPSPPPNIGEGGTGVFRHEESFDGYGRLIGLTTFDHDGTVLTVNTYSYDVNGDLSAMVIVLGDDVTIFKFYPDGTVKEILEYNSANDTITINP
jgi:hypothetical protein